MAIDWQKYWNELAQNSDFHAQVGRTVANKPLDNEIIEKIVARIVQILDLQAEDILLDVCCGNGMISHHLAKYCKAVIGVDISSEQISLAKQFNSAENISYFVADATKLSEVIHNQANKINLYFSFQYIDTQEKGERTLAEMKKCLLANGKILIGDVPEKEKRMRFYTSLRSKIWYVYYELRKKNPMGKFWHYKEMLHIAQKTGFTIEKIAQPEEFPYSHYRCDYLLIPVS